jgi:hypothetical protein
VRGGEVWWIRRGSDLLYTNGREEPKPTALAAAQRAARAVADSVEAELGCVAPRAGEADGAVLGRVVDERGAPLADAVVTVEWQRSHTAVGRGLAWETQGLSTVTRAGGAYHICGVPGARLLTVFAQYGTRKTPKVSTRIALEAKRVKVDLRVAGVRAPAPTGVVPPPGR